MKLKELCDISNGSILSRFRRDTSPSQLPVITVKAAENPEENVSLEWLDDSHPQLLRAQKGDLIMSMTQPNTFIIDDRLAGWVVPSTFAYFHIQDPNQLMVGYLKWFLDASEEYQRQLYLLKNGGGAIQFLKINDLKEVNITLPNMDQQKKVASMMSIIQKETELYQKKMKLQTALMNYQGNQWIKENQHGN